MGKYDFTACKKPERQYGAWSKVIIDFAESDDECRMNTYPTTKDAANAAAALQTSIKKLGYQVKDRKSVIREH